MSRRRREEEQEEASDAPPADDDVEEEEEQQQGEDSEQEEAAWRAEAERAQQRKRQKGLLGKSRLTHQDRRHVRHKERELLQSMRENAQDLARLSSEAFRETTRELQQMYEDVCYPREANLDASNLDELNVAVAKQSQALGSSDLTKFDTADLIRATREACTSDSQGGNFDWNTLGTAAGACFRAVPDIGFLFGMMDTEVVHKQRKRTRRAVEDEETKESRPSEYTNKKDRKDAQARRLEVLQNTIERENKRAFFDMVINPKSFTQTVENIFDTSFLVRNGSAGIDVDESGLPFVENYEGRNEADAMRIQAQSIISITPAQWQQISQVWGTEEPLIGHRS